eukprot:gb/GEZN01007219.1/.p1 GENE.gb/GEZN01007219.1/~~gb/GEZN01007219.1/.p1  ORF type:complete len:409 (-),score=57.78 gb/GEZN01007219.1/:315-1541(-)
MGRQKVASSARQRPLVTAPMPLELIDRLFTTGGGQQGYGLAAEKADQYQYAEEQKILLVGEGNFTFSQAIAKQIKSGKNIVATSFDSKLDVLRKYPEARETVRALRLAGARVIYGVDARHLEQEPSLCSDRYDRIVFNFPHVGGSKPEDVQRNQVLLRAFFSSAKSILSTHGQIHVALRGNDFYKSWDIEAQARQAGLPCLHVCPFDPSLFPGYRNCRTNPAFRDAPDLGDALHYIFSGTTNKIQQPVKTKSGSEQRNVAAATALPPRSSKPNAAWFCKACGVRCATEKKWNGHNNSKKHAKKQKLFRAQSTERSASQTAKKSSIRHFNKPALFRDHQLLIIRDLATRSEAAHRLNSHQHVRRFKKRQNAADSASVTHGSTSSVDLNDISYKPAKRRKTSSVVVSSNQ